MRNSGRFSLAIALALATTGPVLAQEAPSQLSLRSGVSGGSWYPIGASVMEILGADGVNTNAEPGGAASNLLALDAGQIELGFTMGILPELARAGEPPFDTPLDGIQGIAVMFPNFGHVMVRGDSGIETIADLAGETFASQAVGTGTQIVFADMLEAYGISEDDLELTRGGQGHGADQVRDRQAVGVTATTAAPSGTFTELTSSQDLAFLEIDDEHFEAMGELNPGYVRATLPAGTYAGQDEEVAGVGTDTILVVSEDMSEEHAYWITKRLVENLDRLNEVHGTMRELTAEAMAGVQGVDLHPGARRYYEEAGLL